MSYYKNCAITNISLDQKECVVFLISKTTNKPFGLPLFSQYNETNGSFSFKEDDIKESFNVIQSFFTKHNQTYSFIEHEKLFSSFSNKEFFFYTILKPVYDSLLKTHSSYATEIDNNVLENLKIKVEHIKTTFQAYKMIKDMEQNGDLLTMFINTNPFLKKDNIEDVLNTYSQNEDMFYLIDQLLRDESTISANSLIDGISCGVDHPDFYSYLLYYKSKPSKDIYSLFVKGNHARSNLLHQGINFIKFQSHKYDYSQGASAGIQIEFYKHLSDELNSIDC